MEWLKAGPGHWVARNNAYTIVQDGDSKFSLTDGTGRWIGTASSLKGAKDMAALDAR